MALIPGLSFLRRLAPLTLVAALALAAPCALGQAIPPAGATPATGPSTAPAGVLDGLPILKVEVAGNPRTSVQLILDQYKKKGYIDAEVTVDKKLLAEKGVVRFEIVEGPVSAVTSVVYSGISAGSGISDDYINWRITTKPRLWIFRKGLLDPDKLP